MITVRSVPRCCRQDKLMRRELSKMAARLHSGKYDCAGESQPSSRQRGRPTSTKPQLSGSNKNLVCGPKWELDTMKDWPSDRRS
jgi:hypothetical protein